MSLDVRCLTDGEKTVWMARNTGVRPIRYDLYRSLEEVPKEIRYYAERAEPETPDRDMTWRWHAFDEFFHGACMCELYTPDCPMSWNPKTCPAILSGQVNVDGLSDILWEQWGLKREKAGAKDHE